jgi:hypothetical protein
MAVRGISDTTYEDAINNATVFKRGRLRPPEKEVLPLPLSSFLRNVQSLPTLRRRKIQEVIV